jgi:hypothetical protein
MRIAILIFSAIAALGAIENSYSYGMLGAFLHDMPFSEYVASCESE